MSERGSLRAGCRVRRATRPVAATKRGKTTSGSGSKAEELLAAHLRAAGIQHKRQHRWHPTRRFAADFAFDEGVTTTLLVEVDGGLFVRGRHSRGPAREADMERDAEAMMLGWTVLRVSPRHVKTGKALAWIEAISRRFE